MIWMLPIFPHVFAVLQQNNLAKQGREEVVITPQQRQWGGVTVHMALSLLQARWRQGTRVLAPKHVYLCRQPFNLHRTGVCEQQSLSPPHLPVTRLESHLSRCLGGPASGKHSQQRNPYCWHSCVKNRGEKELRMAPQPQAELAARAVSTFWKGIRAGLYVLKAHSKLLFYPKFQFEVSEVL